MADLYLCRQEGPQGFQKLVAVKRIREEHCLDEEFTTMFLDEARIAALLTHANIAQIYELGMEDERPFLAMEFVNGRNLSAVIKLMRARSLRMPAPLAVHIMIGVLRGLEYAHHKRDLSGAELNLVHRDVTPQNVLVSVEGEVKLVDFGIAKASTQVAQTRHGVLKGKYAYMSPEQVKGMKLDGRSDLFACGILLYELLCSHRPFKRSSAIKTLKAIVSEAPPDPRQYNPALATDVVKIIGRALYKNRSKRFENAETMAQTLERWLYKQTDPPGPRALSNWIEALFAEDENKGERTMVVRDIGEILLPPAREDASQSQVVEGVAEGVLQGRVDTMLSSVNSPATGEISVSFNHMLDGESSVTRNMASGLDSPPEAQEGPDPTVVSGPPASLDGEELLDGKTETDQASDIAGKASLPAPETDDEMGTVAESQPDQPASELRSLPMDSRSFQNLPPAADPAELLPAESSRSTELMALLPVILAGAVVGLLLVLAFLLLMGS